MKKIFALSSLVLSISMLSSSVFAFDLVGLRAARKALYVRTNISSEEAEALHKISTEILRQEAIALRGYKAPQQSSKYKEVSQISALEKERFELIKALEVPRNEDQMNQLIQINVKLNLLENSLIEEALSDINGND